MTADEPTTDPGWFEDPVANPDLPAITEWDGQEDPVPPAERLAAEPAEVEVDDHGQRTALEDEGPPGDEEDGRPAGPVPRGRAAVVMAGLSLTDYSRSPQARGFGPPCTVPLAKVQLTHLALSVNKLLAELIWLIMAANEKQGYLYCAGDTGCMNCRPVAGTSKYSWHSWAVAIDACWKANPQRRPVTTNRPRWELDRWNRYGFAWGGDYSGGTVPDSMHTEYMGTVEQIPALLALARKELLPIINGTATAEAVPQLRNPVVGSIRACFDRVGGLALLGQPLDKEVPTIDPAGRLQRFEHGNVYWHPKVDRGTAHELHGAILARFVAAGNEPAVGWPATDEHTCPDRVGRFVHFLRGTEWRSIYWTPATGARIVKGGIRGAWEAQGWEGGIGYPVDEEHPAEDGIVQTFQRGSILWRDGKGTVRRK
jgi:hypothetical protein